MQIKKRFNVTGLCIPEKHYMVDIRNKVNQIIEEYIAHDYYFTINRARQYGKTTTLRFLEQTLKDEAIVIRISFEGKEEYFVSLQTLARGLCLSFQTSLRFKNIELAEIFAPEINQDYPMRDLSQRISTFCEKAGQRTVLMIDEVDKAADHATFLSFLGVLRDMYLAREDYGLPAFHNVILAGVYDIKNLKLKLRPEERHNYNSPWNIAADFDVDMSFSKEEIAGMLKEYDKFCKTGMDIDVMAQEIYNYTSGYPYLVSRICKLIDEQLEGKGVFEAKGSAWTRAGILEAVKRILSESNTLFDDMQKKISDYPELRKMLYATLFAGQNFPYNPSNHSIRIGSMFGFIKEKNGHAVIANRIFETWFYNLFISEEVIDSGMYQASFRIKNQFVKNGFLDMELVLKKFMEHFTDIYKDSTDTFVEENGRRLFLLYLKPIINGTGNYYIEARTRSMGRTDVIVDYLGQQYIIELKIWHGNEYNQRGELQLVEYLNDYHLEKGYMVSFNFNKKKNVEMKYIQLNGKTLVEVVV